jgi:mannitol-1-phosphate/altronate dehydrogenase
MHSEGLDCRINPHRAVMSFARSRSPELTSWIAENVTFPCSMVDRITSSTFDTDRGTIARTFSVADSDGK